MTDLVEPEVPIAGWICLEWGERRFAIVPAGERPAVLLGNLALRVQPADPASLSDLMTLPMFALRHPRNLDQLAVTSEFLLAQLEPARVALDGSPAPSTRNTEIQAKTFCETQPRWCR